MLGTRHSAELNSYQSADNDNRLYPLAKLDKKGTKSNKTKTETKYGHFIFNDSRPIMSFAKQRNYNLQKIDLQFLQQFSSKRWHQIVVENYWLIGTQGK